MKFAQISAAALALVLASSTAASAQDAPIIIDNGTGDAVVVPLNASIADIEPGDTKWVALNWTSLNADARNLKVTAAGPDGVTVEYPTFPVSGYSSGYSNSTLSESEIDYTALKLTIDEDVDGPVSLTVTVSYDSDTGSHVNQHEMPVGDDGNGGVVPISSPTLPVCDLMVIDSFQQGPTVFTFQVRNTTKSPVDYEFVIPNANYQLDNLKLNGSFNEAVLNQTSNGDGTYTITVSGQVPKYRSIGGQQPNGFDGDFQPASGDPFVRCA